MKKNNTEKVIQIVSEKGILRARELEDYGISSKILTRLVNKGQLIRIGRGLYRLPGVDYESTFQNFIKVQKRFPNSVICLISALAFHELTTQIPFETWIAIHEKARRPQPDGISIRVVRFSKKTLQQGVEQYLIENVPVRITNPARTVADCFKYRNKIGLDIALEGLKEGLRDHCFTRDELWQYAKLCRVSNVIRPYLESMV